MHGRGEERHAPVITDARRSLDEEQRRRKKVYATLMALHLIGFTLAGIMVHIWWLALALVIVTGPLPWVAVITANDRRPNPAPTRHEQRPRQRELGSSEERTVQEGSPSRSLGGRSQDE